MRRGASSATFQGRPSAGGSQSHDSNLTVILRLFRSLAEKHRLTRSLSGSQPPQGASPSTLQCEDSRKFPSLSYACYFCTIIDIILFKARKAFLY